MSTDRKPSSPIADALRLFFRNPSAVIALILITLLASAATTGKLLTGKPPTPAQYKLMEEADELGDSVDLDVNPNAVMDPNQTMLRDKFLPPFSKSKMSKEDWQQQLKDSTPESVQETEAFRQQLEQVEPKMYWLGTDHLGRDVLAQLWAGSSISLTIGFLAVGISVFLGVSLGGIAGFFGRRPVRLPMLVMLLFALMGGIAIPAEAPGWGLAFFIIAGLAFGYQLVVALAGKRYRPVIGFAVVALIVGLIFLFNWNTETNTPEGRMLQQARMMDDASRDVLLMTRDLGRERKKFENKEPGYKDEAWFNEEQLRLDVAYRNLYLLESEYAQTEYLTELEKDARLGQDLIERADHLEAHIDDSFNPKLSEAEVENLEPEAKRQHVKFKNRKDAAVRARKTGEQKVERAGAITEAIQPFADAAFEAIEAERATMEFEDFDFQDYTARVNKLLETDLALKRVGRAAAMLTFVEDLSSSLVREDVQPFAFGTLMADWHKKELDKAKAEVTRLESAVKQSGGDKMLLQRQLEDAKTKVVQLEAASSAVTRLKDAGTDAKAQYDILMESAVDFGDASLGIHRLMYISSNDAEFVEQIPKVGGDKPEDEEQAKLWSLARQLRDFVEAAKSSTQIVDLTQQMIDAKRTVDERLEWITKPESELTEEQKKDLEKLNDYDYTAKSLQDGKTRDPYFTTIEPSEKLLNRRADLRATYLKKYEADAKNRFEGSGGLLEAKLQNGAFRYQAYRITRHFITITILILLLVVAALIAAAAAQGAAEDIKGPLAKPFIPTISVDDLVMRFTEIMLTIPTIYLILAVLALFQKDVYIVMAVIGLTSWMGTTRFVRAEILSLREQDFIQAARALGVSDYRIVWRHLVPNAISPVLVSATIGVATAVLAESTLSFLGIGAAPDQPTWGQILSTGRAYITDYSWLTWIPGIAILITVLSFNLLGEGLREAFNPKLRGR